MNYPELFKAQNEADTRYSRAVSPPVFVLGSGFSAAVCDIMPTMAPLRALVVEKLTATRPELIRVPYIDTDIELALTFLFQRHAWLDEPQHLRNRALGLELTQQIATEIESCERAATVVKPLWVPWSVRLAYHIHRMRGVVVTFNYDTVLEKLFEELQTREDSHRITKKDLWPDIFAVEGGLLRDVRPGTATILKLHGSLGWYYSGRSSYFGEQISRSSRGRVPLIIPPSTDKSGYFEHEGMRSLWNEASTALERAPAVFCIGYSLPSSDLAVRYLLQTAIPPTTPIYLINRGSVEDHYREMLPDRPVRQPVSGDEALLRLTENIERDYLEYAESRVLESTASGPVEHAIRHIVLEEKRFEPFALVAVDQFQKKQTVSTATLFGVAEEDQRCEVATVSPTGLSLYLGAWKIPVFLGWAVLEQIIPHTRNAPEGVLDVGEYPPDGQYRTLNNLFAKEHAICVSTHLILLLLQAGVLDAIHPVGKWRLTLGPGLPDYVIR